MPPLSRRHRLSWPASAFAAAGMAVFVAGLFGLLAGCKPSADVRPGDIRSYTLPRDAEPALPAAAGQAAVTADGGSQPAAALRYEVPDGWSDGGGRSGMRLATLFIGPPADKQEVTVIPASGSLEGNVSRWQGQLQPDAAAADLEARVAAAVAAAERVDVGAISATIVLLRDTTPAGPDDDAGQAILGAMIPVDDSRALFVKFKGDAAVALRERDRFKQFVASIRREE